MNDAEIKLKVSVDGKEATNSINKVSEAGKKIGKAIGRGALLAGTALVGLVGKSVQMAGDLEQQIGGTEAVFGDFAKTVQDQAKKSFSTMGTSANDYMQTINKMGALMQGSGIKQEKAMNLSAQAMQRTADVASIMGIDISFAMDSIAGAAKGNFTMMDNLGVAMNATTIEAYALSKGVDKSFNSMTKAEQVGFAMEMFLEKTSYATGNYAKENDTFAGSLNTLKASFGNFMAGVGDIDQVIENVISFGKILVESIVKMAPKIIDGIIELVNGIIPMLPSLLEQLLPSVIKGVISLAVGIVKALPEIIKVLATMLPMILEALITGASDIILALAQALPDMIPIIIEAVLALIPILLDNLPLFIDAGIQLTVGLIKGIIMSIPKLLEYIPKIIGSIFSLFAKMPAMALNAGKDLIYGLWNGIKDVTKWLYDKIAGFTDGVLKKIKSFFGIKSPSKEFAIIGRYNVEGLEEGMKTESQIMNRNLDDIFGAGLNMASKMGVGSNYAPISSGKTITLNIAMGDISMDGNKIGRAITPYITKTVKLSGGNV